VGVDVLELRTVDDEHPRRRDDGVGLHDAGLERGRDRHDLVRGPGFEHVGHRAVPLAGYCRLRGAVRGLAVDVGHGEDVAGAHVHHDRHAALGVERVHLVDERALGLVLDRLIERENEVDAALCRAHRALGPRQVVAGGIAFDGELTRATREGPLERRFQAAQAVVVEADEPEHGAREVARWVVALRLGHETDADEAEPAHLGRDVGLDLPGDVHERLVTLREAAAELELVDADDGRELRRDVGRVLDDARIGPDGLPIERQRELVAVAVEDAAAIGSEGDVLDPLVAPERCERCTVAGLDVGDARREHGEDHDDDREDPRQPSPGRCGVRTPERRTPRARVGRARGGRSVRARRGRRLGRRPAGACTRWRRGRGDPRARSSTQITGTRRDCPSPPTSPS
jgi:hypothetical protein